MTWIKIEIALPQKPEVIRIGRFLGLSPEAVCGWLVRFWGWYDTSSVDGVVDGVEPRDVDMIVSLPGFADALTSVGWLKFDAKTKRLVMPNFDRHNGESSKKRALKARRQARWRDGNTAISVDGVVDGVVDKVASTREEKIREDNIKSKSNTKARSALHCPSDVLETVWNDFQAIRNAKRIPLTATALEGIRAQAVRAKMSLEAALKMCCERGWQGFKAEWVDQPKKGNGNGKFNPGAYVRELEGKLAEEVMGARPSQTPGSDLHEPIPDKLPRSAGN